MKSETRRRAPTPRLPFPHDGATGKKTSGVLIESPPRNGQMQTRTPPSGHPSRFAQFGYPLRAPAVSPDSSRFWNRMYTTSVGNIVITSAANSAP